MEKLGRGGRLDDLQVIFGAELQETFESGGGVFGTLAFVAVGKQHHNPAGLAPFRFCGGDELVDDDLRAVSEVAELRLPDHERIWGLERVAVIKAQDGVFRQRGVHELDLGAGDGAKRTILRVIGRVMQHGVPVGECAAFAILPG